MQYFAFSILNQRILSACIALVLRTDGIPLLRASSG